MKKITLMEDKKELKNRMQEMLGIKATEKAPTSSSSASNIVSKLANARDRSSMPSKDEIRDAIKEAKESGDYGLVNAINEAVESANSKIEEEESDVATLNRTNSLD